MKQADQLYQVGDTVFAKVKPDLKLIVRRYIKRIYYCTMPEWPEKKDIVLFEREIINKKA